MDAAVNLDKPKGITSHEAVTRVKRIFGVKKAGHAGTLDPIATGVLIVCTGEGTKITRFLADMEKEYVATLKLGERTDTFDAEGRVTERKEGFSVDEAGIRDVLERFTGAIRQTPPMYSAIKVSGKPLYKLARKGIVLERAEREVTIDRLVLEGMDPPFVTLRVACSKGTYIRSLCDDIGQGLGTGAHMTELRRVGIGDFLVSDAAGLDELPERKGAVRSLDSALVHLRDVSLNPPDFRLASHGGAVKAGFYGSFREDELLRLKGPEGNLFAVGRALGEKIKIERILHLENKLKPII
jgi:tRNA pseudouridine55 synthase